MKKVLYLSAFLFAYTFAAKAADLIVQENGLPPTYSSISAAVAAANPGDRIFIQNRAGNVPYYESVNITKSLTFVSYVNDSFFFCQGNWTIAGGATQMTVNIIGMVNESGTVSSTADGPSVSSRDTIRILGGSLYSGSILFNNNYYQMEIYGVKLNSGHITYRHGSIIGDSIAAPLDSSGINVISETTGTGIPTSDTSYIVGNIIWTNDNTGSCCSYEFICTGINWESNTMFFYITNNLIYFSDCGIYTSTSRASNAAINKLYNNTVIWNNNNSNYGYYYSSNGYGYGTYGWMGMYLETGGSGSIIEVMNNVIAKATSPTTAYEQNGLVGVPNGGAINAYYNFVGTGWVNALNGSLTVNSNNNTTTPLTASSFGNGAAVGNWTGNSQPTYPPSSTNLGFCSALVNDGNPGSVYSNLDLSSNTVGAYGGSYTLLNFFPQNAGATRTWIYYYPFNARIGTTLSIEASTFAR